LAEPDRLASVLEHLIQNAQEATADDGRVNVRIRRLDGIVEIEVADTGSGMDAKFISERLFRPFDTTKGNAGMGVGVYESREFVTAVGGHLEVESQPGRGTVFRMQLPLEVDGLGGPKHQVEEFS
jgi:signal transduction histidine kinase